MLAFLECGVSADDAIVVFAEFRVGEKQADIPPSTEVHHLARDGEHTLSCALRRCVSRREHTKRVLSRSARQPESPAWIDDLPRMHGCAHRRVATRAGDVEQTQPFHEEGPLLAEERREALI